MRLLRINGQQVDIDETTAIGLTFSGYDISQPGKTFVTTSNSFSLPRTMRNLNIIGWAGNPQTQSTIFYDLMSCDYYIDNFHAINGGRAILDKVTNNRIFFKINEKTSIWDEMADLDWSDFTDYIITYLGLPTAGAQYTGGFSSFIDDAISLGLKLPLVQTNMAKFQPDGINYLESISQIWLKYNNTISGTEWFANGGHWAIRAVDVFKAIESYFAADFSTGETFDYNIFNDTFGKEIFVPLNNLIAEHTTTGFYFKTSDVYKFEPENVVKSQEGKSVNDFVKAYFQIFNCVIDNKLNGGYKVRRFDDIGNAEVEDFSNIQKEYDFAPYVNGIKQINYITFSKTYNDAYPLLGSKKIVCNNKNIQAGGSDSALFSIDSYIPGTFANTAEPVLDLSVADAISNFTFLIDSGVNQSVEIKSIQDVSGSPSSFAVTKSLDIANVYGLSGEYNTFASMVSYPKFYTVKKYLNLAQVINLEFFKKYFVRELNGYFFLNKIHGFNPNKSSEPVKIELVKI